ncbi:MAG: glycosyltransferase family 4 protein [Candidatus Moraniibacteriota bacterium]|nr:MAG: glycosyltransferase family 4 protein [Candidatus Moranbacteria bacterium]
MKQILLATRPIVPPWDEASKNFAYFLAKNIRNEDLTMHVLTTPEGLKDMGTNVILHPLYSKQKTGAKSHYPFLQKARLPLYLFAQSFKYDIVHYLFTPTLFNAFVIKYFTPFRPKSIQTVATLREDRYPRNLLKHLFFADQLATYTDATKTKLNALGFDNVERIYPGIDLEKYQPRPKSQAVLDSYNLTPEDFLVVYPGEYTRLGATDYLVETLIRHFTAPISEPFIFLFACRIKNEADRVKREEVRERFRQAGCLEHIRFDDGNATADMATVYNTADVIAFPVGDLRGKFDVPLVIIEAYACGKPVILSDLEAFREFSNDQISVTIPRLDDQALIDTILYLKHNSDTRAAIGQTARTYAETHFDLRETARHYGELYASL